MSPYLKAVFYIRTGKIITSASECSLIGEAEVSILPLGIREDI